MQFPMFEALVRGISIRRWFPDRRRRGNILSFAGKVITFEQACAVSADYLAGDTYYKVHYDGQNLDRCRTQFKLIESIEQQEEKMERLVESVEW